MSSKYIKINKKINKFNKTIEVDGDKSLSIRWALLASQAIGNSKAFNLLRSEDTLNTLKCLKKLGVKIKLSKKFCQIEGRGINGFLFKKNITLNAGNSGTLGRLLLPLLIKSPHKIKIVGDKSLSKRDFSRVTMPLKNMGVNFYPQNKKNLPIDAIISPENEVAKAIFRRLHSPGAIDMVELADNKDLTSHHPTQLGHYWKNI